jgi:hypothetical protein
MCSSCFKVGLLNFLRPTLLGCMISTTRHEANKEYKFFTCAGDMISTTKANKEYKLFEVNKYSYGANKIS